MFREALLRSSPVVSDIVNTVSVKMSLVCLMMLYRVTALSPSSLSTAVTVPTEVLIRASYSETNRLSS